jgi:membrane-associated protease RseP (regulator of RpoE activity)
MRSNLARWCIATALLALTAIPTLAAGTGYLGVTTQATNEELRAGLDLTKDGLLVNQVSDDSPADKAGVKKGDVILSYNSRTVKTPEELRQLVRDTAPGKSAALGVWRDGKQVSLQVTVGTVPSSEDGDDDFDTPIPPSPPRAPRPPSAPHVHRRISIDGHELNDDEIDRHLDRLKSLDGMHGWSGPNGSMMFMPSRGSRGRLGVRIEKLNSDLGQALGVDGGKGVLVTEVMEDTPAQKAGLKAGDVIVKVGADSVDTPDELVKAVDAKEGKITLSVQRKGVKREVQAELAPRSEQHSYWVGDGDSDGTFRFSEPGKTPRVYRWKTKADDGDETDLREELRQLKQELREMREQMSKEDKK